jgi:hypothetical protein
VPTEEGIARVSFTASVKRRLLLASVTVLAGLTGASTEAKAGIVTVGSPLTQSFTEGVSCIRACTLAPSMLPGATATSPVNGAIVRWRMIGGSSTGTYRLRVLRHGNGLEYTGAGASAAMRPAGSGIETFPTALPIHAGDSIGIDVEAEAPVGAREIAGSQYQMFLPPPLDGSVGTAVVSPLPLELGFDAEVQPAPTISSLKPAIGPLQGENSVKVAGRDLGGARSVRFGAAAALSFTVDSEFQITAVVPPAVTPGKVAVSVTTDAGTGVSPAEYTYEGVTGGGGNGGTGGGGTGGGGSGGGSPNPPSGPAPSYCLVPSVKRVKLTGAKRKLHRAGCALGKVRRRQGVSLKTGRVVGQRPKPGKIMPAGGKVSLTFGR